MNQLITWVLYISVSAGMSTPPKSGEIKIDEANKTVSLFYHNNFERGLSSEYEIRKIVKDEDATHILALNKSNSRSIIKLSVFPDYVVLADDNEWTILGEEYWPATVVYYTNKHGIKTLYPKDIREIVKHCLDVLRRQQ